MGLKYFRVLLSAFLLLSFVSCLRSDFSESFSMLEREELEFKSFETLYYPNISANYDEVSKILTITTAKNDVASGLNVPKNFNESSINNLKIESLQSSSEISDALAIVKDKKLNISVLTLQNITVTRFLLKTLYRIFATLNTLIIVDCKAEMPRKTFLSLVSSLRVPNISLAKIGFGGEEDFEIVDFETYEDCIENEDYFAIQDEVNISLTIDEGIFLNKQLGLRNYSNRFTPIPISLTQTIINDFSRFSQLTIVARNMQFTQFFKTLLLVKVEAISNHELMYEFVPKQKTLFGKLRTLVILTNCTFDELREVADMQFRQFDNQNREMQRKRNFTNQNGRKNGQ